jgi:hypothetical protein
MLDETAAQGILKRYFQSGPVQNSIAARKGAVYRDMETDPKGGGKKYEATQIIKDIFAVSASFTIAQARAAANQTSPGLAYSLPYQELNSVAQVSAKANALSMTDNVAWVKAIGFAAASAMRMFHFVGSVFALGTGWGEVSTTAIVYSSGAGFTIANGAVNKIVEGMPLVASDSIHADALRSATAANVTAVDYSTGAVTTDVADLAGTLSWATGDFIFFAGCRENVGSGNAVRLCPVGLRTWIPEVRPVVDAEIITVEGTSRAGNSRAYGNQNEQSGSAFDAIQQLITACVVIGNAEKGKFYVSHARYNALATELRSDQRFVNNKDGSAGWLKLSVNAVERTVQLDIDKYLEDDVGYFIASGSYESVSAGGEYGHIDATGGQWTKLSASNGREMRIMGFAAFFVNNPAACGVTKFTAL